LTTPRSNKKNGFTRSAEARMDSSGRKVTTSLERQERKRRSRQEDADDAGITLRPLVPPGERAAQFWPVQSFERDFRFIKPLGTGTFGKVTLCRYLGTGQLCAVKRVLKAHVLRFKQEVRLLNERACLRAFDSPFVVRYYASFSDADHLFFCLEYLPGGELFTRIHTAKRGDGKHGLKPSHARFYAAEVILALEYLHSWHVLYRDLKPENVLLDAEGHVRLVDLGFACQTATRSYSVVGTTEYLSPEIVLGRGINTGGDWWAVGILIFEMLCGYTPFKASTKMACYQRIIHDELVFPSDWPSRSGKALVRALLQKQSFERLGVTNGGVKLIKQHEFFESIDWDELARRAATPPWHPRCANLEDTRHFHTDGQDFDDPDINIGDLNLAPEELSIFDGF
jgi:serine/threonine protein kinase